ncbi:MAG: bifunctional 4-hydroxy-2-oxoglutarate aldolase/2-dehydro-3-deoxy-phosphogluconate aldolase [Eubacteriales bacterium]|nr:bifunctional 4-hydroxy-2-oxoglutarate aldolase/2-dehydro-3-deoxy-phosphogluconate aldolase [Eubacteriales bacterium]
MNDKVQRFMLGGVVPVIRIDDPETAVPLADALRRGGLNGIEVTVRNDTALEAIRRIRAAFPDMAVGAGTIMNVQQAQEALQAGVDFIVAPGLDEETVRFCTERNIPIVPGCVTPSEVQKAVNLGLTTVKFFPADMNGGVKGVQQLHGPFGKVKFVPTCGIDYSNLPEYLRHEAVIAVGGSFMAKADVIAAHDWDAIAANCRRAVQLALGFELAHVGLNCASEAEALSVAALFESLFGLPVKNGNSSVFSGKAVEMMKSPYRGEKGHIGFYANSAERAYAYFQSRGVAIAEETVKRDKKGLIAFYLEQEIGGFAVHIVRR